LTDAFDGVAPMPAAFARTYYRDAPASAVAEAFVYEAVEMVSTGDSMTVEGLGTFTVKSSGILEIALPAGGTVTVEGRGTVTLKRDGNQQDMDLGLPGEDLLLMLVGLFVDICTTQEASET
jgi:hypothetical protein